ncbi:MAG: D-3-phosphoglycerate dehydrogenase [Paracoccaceae bacterium]
MTAALTAALMTPQMGEGSVNMVSAPIVARERGIKIAETRKDAQGAYGTYMRLVVITEKQTRSIAGTIFSDGRPRIVQIKGIGLEAEPQPFMLYTTNSDTPGYIGALGTMLGKLDVNIATFALGRSEKGGEAIAVLGIDRALDADALAQINALPQVTHAKALKFAL